MPGTNDLLNSILDRASAAEAVSIVRVLKENCSPEMSIWWRDEFRPSLEHEIESLLRDKMAEFEASGGVADLLTFGEPGQEPVSVVLEVVRPRLKLVVFGAGHVGQSVALIGGMLGYEVIVVDDRHEFASRERFQDRRIRLLVADPITGAERAQINQGTAVVIVTRGHQSDELCLKTVLQSRATYLGMIGSRRRVLGVFKRLTADGFSEESLSRVHAPIGLRIGARTPQEIAVSILAEIIEHVNKPKDDGEMRNAI